MIDSLTITRNHWQRGRDQEGKISPQYCCVLAHALSDAGFEKPLIMRVKEWRVHSKNHKTRTLSLVAGSSAELFDRFPGPWPFIDTDQLTISPWRSDD